MPNRTSSDSTRRHFLQWSAGMLFATSRLGLVSGGDRPPVVNPRATSGDAVVEPNWDERLTVTVGPGTSSSSPASRLVGNDEKVIQAAVDYVARFGGGTVEILPGTYRMRNAVYLSSGVRIKGSGAETVLIKEPSVKTKLAADSDWYDQEITLVDAKGFAIGDGVCLQTKNPHNGGTDVAKHTLVARSGNRFKLDRPLRQNFWEMGDSTAATLFPLFSGERIADVTIENLSLDGNREHNENLNGNYAGCIFLQDCNRVTMRKVTAQNYNGDGISWQICHDVVVEECHSHDHAGLGLHPGSGSQRPVIRNNRIERNEIGIFFCWGVKFGIAEQNRITGSRKAGVSIGHRDNHNLIRKNEILGSGEVGILFRPERGKAFAPHFNRVEENRIEDSGDRDGIAIDVQGETESIELANNSLRETRMPLGRIGIRLGPQAGAVELVGNRVEGFSQTLLDLRKT